MGRWSGSICHDRSHWIIHLTISVTDIYVLSMGSVKDYLHCWNWKLNHKLVNKLVKYKVEIHVKYEMYGVELNASNSSEWKSQSNKSGILENKDHVSDVLMWRTQFLITFMKMIQPTRLVFIEQDPVQKCFVHWVTQRLSPVLRSIKTSRPTMSTSYHDPLGFMFCLNVQ